jgi:signal transduction histidine kinase
MNHLELAARLMAVLAAERAQLAAELHDGLMQHIVGARMWLSSLPPDSGRRAPEAKTALDVSQRALDQAARDAQLLIQELSLSHEATLQGELCLHAIMAYWRQRGVRVAHHQDPDFELPEAQATVLALILLWLFKYAVESLRADAIQVQIQAGHSLDVEFTHTGRGRSSASACGAEQRLEGVRALVQLLGGMCQVDELPNGQRIAFQLPRTDPPPNSPTDL